MSHMFKIIKADELSSNKSIVEIEKLKDISKESLSDCKTYGVWGLLGRKKMNSGNGFRLVSLIISD